MSTTLATTARKFDLSRVGVRLCHKGVYSVTLDGRYMADVCAVSKRDALKYARIVAKEAFESPWNQSLIFRGDIVEGDLSATHFRHYLTTEE